MALSGTPAVTVKSSNELRAETEKTFTPACSKLPSDEILTGRFIEQMNNRTFLGFENIYMSRAIEGYKAILKNQERTKDELFENEYYTDFEWVNIIVPTVLGYSRVVVTSKEPYIISAIRPLMVSAVKEALAKYNTDENVLEGKVAAFEGELNEVDKYCNGDLGDTLLTTVLEYNSIADEISKTESRLADIKAHQEELAFRIKIIERGINERK